MALLTFSHSFTTQGRLRGESEGHRDMAVDSQGTIYITDTCDRCIQKLSISRQFIEQFGYLDTKEEMWSLH